MAWYNTGNIALTNGSATVTGSGTNFLVGAQIGEALYAPDGKLYEIQTINSATVITLASTYLGSTASGQNYQIIPTQSLVADLASDVTDLISDFANVRDYAGNGKFNDGAVGTPGITFTQDQDNGLYRIGSNNWALAAGGIKQVDLSATDVEINYAGVKKLASTSTGIDVTGTVTADGLTLQTSENILGWASGNGIIQVPSNLYIRSTGTGDVIFQRDSATSAKQTMDIDGATGDISFYNDAAAQGLFWDSSASALGLGNTSPIAALDVTGTDAVGTLTGLADTVTRAATIIRGSTHANGYGLYIGYGNSSTDAQYIQSTLKTGSQAYPLLLNPYGGKVGIGTGSPTSYASNCLHLNAASTSISLRLTNSTTGSTVSDGSDIEVDGSNLNIVNRESGNIALYTSATERIRITSAGYTKMSPTGTYISATGGYHEMYQNQAGITSYIYNGSTTGDGLLINTNNENTSNFFLAGYSDSALRYNFYIYSNGNIVNRNYSYLGFSDQKLKQDIEDASRQWDDIKAMKFRKYRWKQDVAADANAPYQLGVIAQELEAAGMSGLVEETADKEFYDEVCLDSDGNPVVDEDGNNVTEQKERLTGESTKSVKYSILTMKALVALQEAMTRIESLEARIAALES